VRGRGGVSRRWQASASKQTTATRDRRLAIAWHLTKLLASQRHMKSRVDKLLPRPPTKRSKRTTMPSPNKPGERVLVPASLGELIDKITILEIKSARMTDARMLANVRHELALLREIRDQHGITDAALARLSSDLRVVNEELWDIEDEIRACEREADFGSKFIALARGVYKHNDKRSALKREINHLFNSAIVEEKLYANY
jgi:hypothetical protein